MEFVSLGAYQFGKSLSKMVPLIDLGSWTAIQVFCQISLQKKLKHIPKNVKSLKQKKLTTARSFIEECLSFRYTQLP